MTFKRFLTFKMELAGMQVSDDFIRSFLASKNLKLNDGVVDSAGDLLFLELALGLLLRPDVTEGDMSVKFDRGALMKWYRAECARLGVEDKTRADTVQDISFLA